MNNKRNVWKGGITFKRCLLKQPASLFRKRKSKSKGKKREGEEKNNGLIQCFSLAPFRRKCVALEKIGNEKQLYKKKKQEREFRGKN